MQARAEYMHACGHCMHARIALLRIPLLAPRVLYMHTYAASNHIALHYAALRYATWLHMPAGGRTHNNNNNNNHNNINNKNNNNNNNNDDDDNDDDDKNNKNSPSLPYASYAFPPQLSATP